MVMITLSVALLALSSLVAADTTPFPGCTGASADYEVTFTNGMTPKRFGEAIPDTGLVFSPPFSISHSHRVSVLTPRGYASEGIQTIAEKGDFSVLRKAAMGLRMSNHGVRDIKFAGGPTLPGKKTKLTLRVNCRHSFITVVAMVAPSPDWIVFVANVPLFRNGRFVNKRSGPLFAYDAGTDSGGNFTNPGDTSLDVPTDPPVNIAPLYEDETNVFGMKRVGFYDIRKM